MNACKKRSPDHYAKPRRKYNQGEIKMQKSLITLLTVLAGVLLLLGGAYAQEDMQVVDNSVFKTPQRPAAVFFHDQHNEKAAIDDCAVCHHLYDDAGNQLEDQSSEDQFCADCHALQDEGRKPSLMKAFHLNCKGCHLQQNKGPIVCSQCHPKK